MPSYITDKVILASIVRRDIKYDPSYYEGGKERQGYNGTSLTPKPYSVRSLTPPQPHPSGALLLLSLTPLSSYYCGVRGSVSCAI